MQRSLALLIIGLFFGAGAGFLLAAANSVTLDGHEHAESTPKSHDHSKVEVVPAGDDAPTVGVIMHPDAMSGWNLEIVTTNFTFSPETVGQANEPGIGHAHVYINGRKLARIYSPWMHIDTLFAGETTVSVSLNGNDHRPLSIDGTPLAAETTSDRVMAPSGSWAGIRPNRQNRSRPHGRASSIQPSWAARYKRAKANISCWSPSGSMPEKRYAALPTARNEIAVGLAQADMHSNVSTAKSWIAGSSAWAKICFIASASSAPFGSGSSSLRHVEQIKTVWRKSVSFVLGLVDTTPLSYPYCTGKMSLLTLPTAFTITH